MPPLKPVRVYWDSDVFLAYFNKEPGRISFPIQEPRPPQLRLLPC